MRAGSLSCLCSRFGTLLSGSCFLDAVPYVAVDHICVGLDHMEADDHESKAPVHALIMRCMAHRLVTVGKQSGQNRKLKASSHEIQPNPNTQQCLDNACVESQLPSN